MLDANPSTAANYTNYKKLLVQLSPSVGSRSFMLLSPAGLSLKLGQRGDAGGGVALGCYWIWWGEWVEMPSRDNGRVTLGNAR
jgi:hypothetical protein